MDLQTEFTKFFNTIKLGRFEEESDLREKRDILITALQDTLKDEKIPGTEKKLKFETFHQGSYEMDTGVKPKNNDYDIDLGVMFDIDITEYDSCALKKLVYDKLNAVVKRTVLWKTPCITVNYINDAYHVDLAIYAKNNDNIHIAWGKENASIQKWEISDPKGLTKWVGEVSFDKDKSAQFRRCVRYLKKWKENCFTDSGNYAPPSIGLTIQARNAFDYVSASQSDLSALIIIVGQIKNAFTIGDYDADIKDFKRKIAINLPVEPNKNVYYKMTDLQQNNFFEQVLALEEALVDAKNETSDPKASKILRKVFGDEFPLVEDVKESSVAPIIISGNNA